VAHRLGQVQGGLPLAVMGADLVGARPHPLGWVLAGHSPTLVSDPESGVGLGAGPVSRLAGVAWRVGTVVGATRSI
jgi:hypothetical protein